MHGRTDNVKTVYPLQTKFAGGITIKGPLLARQRNADDGPTLNADLVALLFFRRSGQVLLGNPIFLCFFQGGSGPPVPCSSIRAWFW